MTKLLSDKIADLRNTLNILVENKSLHNEDTLKISQELDILITLYYTYQAIIY